jgi:hypothetical protein
MDGDTLDLNFSKFMKRFEKYYDTFLSHKTLMLEERIKEFGSLYNEFQQYKEAYEDRVRGYTIPRMFFEISQQFREEEYMYRKILYRELYKAMDGKLVAEIPKLDAFCDRLIRYVYKGVLPLGLPEVVQKWKSFVRANSRD